MLIAMKGGTIQGSLNLPAQSLYPSIPTLYAVLSAAKIEVVIWYCGQQVFTLWLDIYHDSRSPRHYFPSHPGLVDCCVANVFPH